MDIHSFDTYCNPISMPNCPRGVDYPNGMRFTGIPVADYRSISDPSVLYYEGKWYLFPSYEIAYVTEDFVHWTHIDIKLTDGSTLHDVFYSPAICVWKGKILLCGLNRPLYIADRPEGPYELLGEFISPDGKTLVVADPALFCDDDGELYLYWCSDVKCPNGVGTTIGTVGVRLSPDDPRRFTTDPIEINAFNPEHRWECFGEHNQDDSLGWIEGQWMYKRNGRYYLIYSGCGTEFSAYAQGVYYSDESPLSGFQYQPNNPLTRHDRGLVSGAGHGCVVDGPNDTIWTFYTTTVCYEHCYERRIGMDQVFMDENGLLFCPEITDTPRFAPATEQAKRGNTATGLAPLFYRNRKALRATSFIDGRNPLYAVDESMLTWWQPAPDDKMPTYTVDLQGSRCCGASRVIWRDVGLDYDAGIVPAPTKYVIECADSIDGPWEILLDQSDNNIEENIAYRSFPAKVARYVRLRILEWADGISIGVVDFCVFGKNA